MEGTQNILEGNWKQARGQVQSWWGELTDDELDEIDGNRTKLAGKLQERYGWQQEKADSEIERFLSDPDGDPNGTTNGAPNGKQSRNQSSKPQGNQGRSLQGNQSGNKQERQARNPQGNQSGNQHGNRERQGTKGHRNDR